jgi:hypothetical protein
MTANVAAILQEFSVFGEPQSGLGGNPFRLRCKLDVPASEEEVRESWPSRVLPQELVEVWSVSRESRLFEDVDYGQWGLLLYTPKASADKTAEQRAVRPDHPYRPDDLVIGEFLGDSEFLVMATKESGSRQILVALPMYGRPDWEGVGVSLTDFLERYLDVRGNKFWEPGQDGANRDG